MARGLSLPNLHLPGILRMRLTYVDGCEIRFAPHQKPWIDSIPLHIPTNHGFHGFFGGPGKITH